MTMITNFRWILFLFFVVYPVQTFGIQSFCVANSVSAGQNASISCHFAEDLSISKSDVIVYLYKVLDNEQESKLVLQLSWIDGVPRIRSEQDYDCDSKLTDHLKIIIYNVTQKHAGRYKCFAAPSKSQEAHFCTLVVNGDLESEFEGVNSNHYTTHGIGHKDVHSSSSLSTFDEKDDKPDVAIKTETATTGNVVTIVFSILAVALLVIVLLLIYAYRKRWICKPHGTHSVNVNVEMGQRVIPNNLEDHPSGSDSRQDQGTSIDNETSGFLQSDSDHNHS